MPEMLDADRRSGVAAGPRVEAATVVFTIYLWAWLVVTLVPLWVLLLVWPQGRPSARLLRGWARLIFRLAGCPLRVRGIDHLLAGEPAVVVANHASYLDSVVLMAALPIDYRFVVNHRAARWPLIGLAVRKAGHLVVERERLADRRACAMRMLDTLRRGTSVVVFPEGTIQRDGTLRPFQRGVFHIAVDSGRPVVPVTLRGTSHVMPGGVWPFRRGTLDVVVHEPIASADDHRREITRLRDQARQAVARKDVAGPVRSAEP